MHIYSFTGTLTIFCYKSTFKVIWMLSKVTLGGIEASTFEISKPFTCKDFELSDLFC